MDFSKTFYEKYSTKNKLFLSQNAFNDYTKYNRDKNKSAKKIFYFTNYMKYKSLSTSPTKNSSKNCITKDTLKSINKLISEKIEKNRKLKLKLNSFYKEEIKFKIRKSNKYKSLFEKTEISQSNYDLEKKLINTKLKSNKKKNNYYYINTTNTTNTNNINININTFNLNTSNISKPENKNKNKNTINTSLNLNLDNEDIINKTNYTKTSYNKDLKKIIKENKKEYILNKIYHNVTKARYLPYSVDFREKNLINFYSQTKNFCYKKYCLFLKKSELQTAKLRSDALSTLGDMELIKFIKFYKLFKPFNIIFERYLHFLKEKINYEFKQKDKLKLIQNELVTDIIILRKNLLNMHKTLKSYLSDKYFLLCVKNATLDLKKFNKKHEKELEIDLQNLETLKRYIKEISELASEENILLKNKNSHEINNNNNNNNKSILDKDKEKNKEKEKEKDIPFIVKLNKIRENFESSFNHNISSEKIFESCEEFLIYFNNSRIRIEFLLRKGSIVETDLANWRDYMSHNYAEIEKAKKNIILSENKYITLNKYLTEEKKKNKILINYRNKIAKFKNYNTGIRITKKIKSLISIILYEDKKLNKFFIKNKKIKENTYTMLKSLENIIIYLIKFKHEQNINNNLEYTKVIKNIEKNNRLQIIEEKKEEYKNKAEKKLREIIEKDTKIFIIPDKRTNVRYSPLKKNNIIIKDKTNKKDDEMSIDLFY